MKLKFQDSPNDPPKRNCTIATLGGSPNLSNLNKYAGLGLEITNSTLRIPTNALRHLFAPVVDKIASHIAYLLGLTECKGIQYLFLVGGFSESTILRKAIQTKVGDKLQILVPPRPGTAVLTGAVQYGFNPNIISSRIALRTVGIETCSTWNDAIHYGRKSIIDHCGEKLCSEVFATFVRIQENVTPDTSIVREYFPIYKKQKSMYIPICVSTKSNVPFTTDPGVTVIGQLVLEMPEPNLHPDKRKVSVAMNFGGTVFSVTATYVRTGKSVGAEFKIPLGIN